MPTITRDTHWRHAGRVPFAVWQKRINDAGGLSRVATYEVWNEAGDDSALMLEFLREESSYASDFAAIPASSNNPWNLQIAGVGLKFSSIVECVRAWRERLYSPIYESGVYLRTQTISELIRVYAPASDGNDTEGYIRGVVDGMNRNGFDPPVTIPSTDPEPIPGEGAPMAVELEILNRVIGVQANAPATLLNRTAPRPIGHNTDNPGTGADALMHATFVKNGGGQSGVSFHWAIDSIRAVQILPLDRIGYHASDGCDNRSTDTGCYDGVAFENCDNKDGDIRKTFDNFCKLIALIEWGDPRINYGTMPKGAFVGFIDRLLGHHDVAYDAKWCPSDFMNLFGEDGWKVEARKRAKAYLAELKGTTPVEPDDDEPTTTPVYAKPDKPKAGTFAAGNGKVFVGVEETVTIKQKVTPRKYAESDQPATGPDLAAGTAVTVTHIVVASDNKLWLITADGSRIPATALVAA
jgi:hypothetical protein